MESFNCDEDYDNTKYIHLMNFYQMVEHLSNGRGKRKMIRVENAYEALTDF